MSVKFCCPNKINVKKKEEEKKKKKKDLGQ
jgi:hypothetical protein